MAFIIDEKGNYIPVFGESNGGGGSSEDYLPAGTTITVAADGGDYTTLQNAFNSLQDKWSNGAVTIQIANGTYLGRTSLSRLNNIPAINIVGESVDGTILKYAPGASGWGNVLSVSGKQRITLKNLTIESDNSSGYAGVSIDGADYVFIDNLKIKNTAQYGITSAGLSNVTINAGGVVILNEGTKGQVGIFAELGSTIYGYYNSVINITNVTSGIKAETGAKVTLNNPTATFTSVTTQYTPTPNNMTAGTGWIFKNN